MGLIITWFVTWAAWSAYAVASQGVAPGLLLSASVLILCVLVAVLGLRKRSSR